MLNRITRAQQTGTQTFGAFSSDMGLLVKGKRRNYTLENSSLRQAGTSRIAS
jgi:hypothetical protein